MVAQDFVTVEDLGRGGRVRGADAVLCVLPGEEFARSWLLRRLTFSLSPQLSSYLVSM